MHPVTALLPALLLAAPAPRPAARPGKPAPAAPPPPASGVQAPLAPEATVRGYRIVAERVTQSQNLALNFDSVGAGELKGTQLIYVNLAVYPPARPQVDNIEGLDPRVVAFPKPDQPVPFRIYASDDVNPLVSGVWRQVLMAQEVGLDVFRLQGLQGELIVYPRAKRVRMEFPLKGKAGQTQTAEGFTAVLKEIKTGRDTVSVVVHTSWPAGQSVARPNSEAPFGITGVTASGVNLTPNGSGGGSTRAGDMMSRQFSMTFSDLKEPLSKVAVEVIVRSGTPQRLAFTLPEIALPDVLPLESQLAAVEEAGNALPVGHAFYAARGGGLSFPAPGAGAAGALLVGLARREGAEFGPWRWLEAAVEPGGQVSLTHLREGTYQVVRLPLPAGAGLPGNRPSTPLEGGVTVEIAPGKVSTLPAFERGARP